MTIGRPDFSPVIIDTSVLIAGTLSDTGASFRLIDLVGKGHFEIALTVPLVLEYEAKLREKRELLEISDAQIDDLLDYYCFVGRKMAVKFLLRPFLPDSGDDLVLEAAFSAGATHIITHNIRHFANVETFGIRPITPIEYLRAAELIR